MFGPRGAFPDFDEDPFFQPHRSAFGNMFSADPFAGFGGAIEDGGGRRGRHGGRGDRRDVARRDDDMFGGDPFRQMNRMMQEMSRGFGSGMMNMQDLGANGGHCYSYSSVQTFSSDGQGQPKFFEATSSTRQAPGGVKETRKTVRDSESGMNKMAIGHHIKDRGHVIERSMNKRTNQRDEKQNFINMDEAEADRFNQEWSSATRQFPDTRPRPVAAGQNEQRPRKGHRRDDSGRAIKY